MILFSKDWARYPTAIADDQTTNKHFLRTAALFKSMGIKNYDFILALHNQSLQGVDPFSESLTAEQKLAIQLECEWNPWYYFREICRIPNANNPLQFKSNRGNISLIWSFLVNIDYALIMPRQTGKSIACEALDNWLLFFKYRNTEIFLFTMDEKLQVKTIDRIKRMQKCLPKWLNPTIRADADNQHSVTCVARKNILVSKVSQADAEKANQVGKGSSYPYTHTDELAAMKNLKISLASMLPATTATRENYELMGLPYGNVFTTTAGRLDSTSGKYAWSYIYSGMPWTEAIYDSVDKFEARETVQKNAISPIKDMPNGRLLIHGTFSHRQLGFTDAWLEKQILLSSGDCDDADMDFRNIWKVGNNESPIGKELLEVISNSEVEPLYTEVTPERYLFRWYINKDEIEERLASSKFILGLDPSNALGGDDNALYLVDLKNLEVIGCCNINETTLNKYALFIANFLIKYKEVTWIPENKASGMAIIDVVATKLLSVGVNPFRRIYNRIADNHVIMEEEYADINTKVISSINEKLYERYKKYFGFATGGSGDNARRILYDNALIPALKSTGHLMKDSVLISEIKGLVKKNGRIDHQTGGHDDSVVAWLLCHWFVKHCKNLQFYGIPSGLCMSNVTADGAVLTEGEIIVKQRIAFLNHEISELQEKLISAPSMTDTMRIEKTLAYKVSVAQELGDEKLSIDSIMEDIRKKKVTMGGLRRGIDNRNIQRLYGVQQRGNARMRA